MQLHSFREQTALHQQHTPEAIAERIGSTTSHSYWGDFILGAIDGAVTTFAIVAGAAGAELAGGVALVLGLANVLADGFSMAAGNFLKAQSDHLTLARFRRLEEMHIDKIPESEREEIRQIFAAKGLSGDVLEQVVDTITDDRERWVNTMLTEEWGLQLNPPDPRRAAISTFVAFVLVGLIPLAPLFFKGWISAETIFTACGVLTMATFAVVGWINGWLNDRSPWRCCWETMLVGGAAAALAYVVGVGLKAWAA